MQADFYHLGSSPVERVAPRIAERVIGDGGRLLIVAGDSAQAALIDERLWDYRPESFLPHGIAGRGAEAEQPILIALAPDPANGARNLLLADGVWREAALAFDRAFLLFDDERVEAARAAWRSLGAVDGVTRNFWRQQDGRWTQIA